MSLRRCGILGRDSRIARYPYGQASSLHWSLHRRHWRSPLWPSSPPSSPSADFTIEVEVTVEAVAAAVVTVKTTAAAAAEAIVQTMTVKTSQTKETTVGTTRVIGSGVSYTQGSSSSNDNGGPSYKQRRQS